MLGIKELQTIQSANLVRYSDSILQTDYDYCLKGVCVEARTHCIIEFVSRDCSRVLVCELVFLFLGNSKLKIYLDVYL